MASVRFECATFCFIPFTTRRATHIRAKQSLENHENTAHTVRPIKTLFLYALTHTLSQSGCFSQCHFYRSNKQLKPSRFRYVSSSPHTTNTAQAISKTIQSAENHSKRSLYCRRATGNPNPTSKVRRTHVLGVCLIGSYFILNGLRYFW
jgi:hypothetical protein